MLHALRRAGAPLIVALFVAAAPALAAPATSRPRRSSSATTSATTTSSPTTRSSSRTGRSCDAESDRMHGRRDRQDGRRPAAAAWRSSRRRRTTRSSTATRRSPRGSRYAEGLTDDAGARAGEGGQGGRLDRRRPARHRSARRAAADRDGLPAGHARPTRRRCASSNDVIILCVHANPGRHGAGRRTGTCASRTRRSDRPTACRGSTRSTSATTTTATST